MAKTSSVVWLTGPRLFLYYLISHLFWIPFIMISPFRALIRLSLSCLVTLISISVQSVYFSVLTLNLLPFVKDAPGFAGLPISNLWSLQPVQDYSAQPLYRCGKWTCITPMLCDLYWLSIKLCSLFKTPLLLIIPLRANRAFSSFSHPLFLALSHFAWVREPFQSRPLKFPGDLSKRPNSPN